MMLDATGHYDEPLTAERLLGWHASLFPVRRSALRRIVVGAWRQDETGPNAVVFRPGGSRARSTSRPRRRHDSPVRWRLSLYWFNDDDDDWLVKAAVAHLWFVTLHPFDDGNGRIARAIADLALARRREEPPSAFVQHVGADPARSATPTTRSSSGRRRGPSTSTPWLDWFLGCLGRAIEGAQTTLAAVLAKARLLGSRRLRDAQRSASGLVLNLLLDGFEGKLTTSKWARLTKISADTALRDIQALVERGLLVRSPAGGPQHELRPQPRTAFPVVVSRTLVPRLCDRLMNRAQDRVPLRPDRILRPHPSRSDASPASSTPAGPAFRPAIELEDAALRLIRRPRIRKTKSPRL